QYADDFLFGYFMAASGTDRKKIRKEVEENRGKDKAAKFQFKRDSILRMNLAKALEPYRHNAVFTQSPLAAEGSKYKNAATSALLHRETAVTAFQYPLALNLDDCKKAPKEWTRRLLQAIGELNEVAGNHARSYYEMAPASIVLRLTNSLVAGYATYGFKPDGSFPEVIDSILHDPPDYPGNEFFLGGKLVKDFEAEHDKAVAEFEKTSVNLPEAKRGQRPPTRYEKLKAADVTLERDPRKLLATVAQKALGGQSS